LNCSINDKTAVILLDDHPMIRLSMETVINKQHDMQVVGNFGRTTDLWYGLQQHDADVLVLDYILGNDELDGLSLIKQIVVHYPSIPILVYTSMENLAVIRVAFQRGIRGYLSKREGISSYLQAIRTLRRGQRYIPEHIHTELAKIPRRKCDGAALDIPFVEQGNIMISRLDSLLSPREAEVIRCILAGMKNSDIAEKLKRSHKTISGHKQAAMKKMGVQTELELFKYHDDLFL
jgi:two-component system, NarL family, captular synthesis response regulator RcsB